MNIAIFTPIPPQRTGIASYSYDLISGLSTIKDLNITVYTNTDGFINNNIEVINVNENETCDYASHELIIYQLGNNIEFHTYMFDVLKKYGGIVHLHDIVLHQVLAHALEYDKNRQEYLYTIRKLYGNEISLQLNKLLDLRVKPWFTELFTKLPCFEAFVQYSDDCIVHSDFAKNKINQLNLESNFSNNKKLTLTINTNENDEKVTTLFSGYPKPLVKRYKFIKGFEEGVLDFQSIRKNNTSKSVLIIDNFKVKEVPVLAKLLTLASLQGIADLLTGEGIRFTDFEMIFSNKDKLMTIDEIYAIGPAISIMMSGYIESKKLVSLRGTLVPATTINRTIASIPLIGNILIGKKAGEGVFGVSFKIKGPPKNLKTTVNPIKTLTPRFITRTLEKIKKIN